MAEVLAIRPILSLSLFQSGIILQRQLEDRIQILSVSHRAEQAAEKSQSKVPDKVFHIVGLDAF